MIGAQGGEGVSIVELDRDAAIFVNGDALDKRIKKLPCYGWEPPVCGVCLGVPWVFFVGLTVGLRVLWLIPAVSGRTPLR